MSKINRRNLLKHSAIAAAGVAMGASTSIAKENDTRGTPNLYNNRLISNSILETIGNTSLLQLRNLVPSGHARILLKIEAENPTGSMKDRMALAMVEEAEKDGRLKKGGRVIEYTGGSTGVSLSLVCSVKGYPLDIVTSDAFSSEKLNHMEALGANLTIIKSDSGGMDEKLTRDMIEAARLIQEEKGGYWTDQLNNVDVLPHYHQMANEIWNQTEGNIDAFVQSVGTAGSLRGITEGLKKHNPNIQAIAVEPSESPVLSGGSEGVHKIDGVGAGFVVPLWQPELFSEIEKVSTQESIDMARWLASEEGIFAGTSTGTNLVAAIRIAKKLGPEATVVTIMADTGMKYLSTKLYKNN